ncbi:hypothetical protein [Mycobacteroides abscessus]|uniref:hypothetical protein n=1 Tax=Mycobacteroides abscessus TaxID=36809 RepID=UPI0003671880|nr:hypothetical protein [Mycobacteroides abscessus]
MRHFAAAFGLALFTLAGCGNQDASNDAVPVVDANMVKLTKTEHALPPDPAGILAGQWPSVSDARINAVSKAIFDLGDDAYVNNSQVTVTHLGAEGQAMGLGDSITGPAQQITSALDGAEFTIGYTKRRMTSMAGENNPDNRGKIVECAEDLRNDLLAMGRQAKGEGDATPTTGN